MLYLYSEAHAETKGTDADDDVSPFLNGVKPSVKLFRMICDTACLNLTFFRFYAAFRSFERVMQTVPEGIRTRRAASLREHFTG